MARLLGVSVVLLVVTVCGVAPARARQPVYRDPPSYQGISRAPRTSAPPAPTPSAPVVLSQAGTFPDVYVDEAGTAHVVWNEDRGDGADVVMYCRIKRRARGCDGGQPHELTWTKDYGPGDGPQYNSGGPPKIVRVGDLLAVFSHRYPTIGVKPDGASSSTVVVWTSGDGGTSWTPNATAAGKWNLGQMAVLAGDNPTILNFGVDPLCDAPGPAAACLEAFQSGAYAETATNLSEGPDQNYNASLVLDEHGAPVTAIEDLAYDTRVRRWTQTGSPTDPATWTPGAVFGADDISLAGGPSGVYLMGKAKSGSGPYSVSRLNQQGAGYARGPAVAVTGTGGASLGRIYESPGGALIAGWQQFGKGLQLRATTGAAGAKPSFAASQRVTDGDGNGQIALGAAADGGGFVAYNHTGAINSEGQIAVSSFGQPAPTGRPGVADLPGGGVVAGGTGTNGSCSELSFGSFVVSASGCLLKGRGAYAGDYVTDREVNLWGLRIIPEGSTQIIIDPRKLTIDTTGSVRVVVTGPAPIGDVTLFRGVLHRDLSAVRPGTTLFEFPTGLYKANILGFDVGANIKVRLERDGVHIPVDLTLPPAFGGFSGHAELIADRTAGLHVDSVHVHIGPVPLGALILNRIDLDFAGADDTWTGAGSITVVGAGTLDISATFQMGAFKEATLSFKPGAPIPIGPFVYLVQIGGGFGLDPVRIDANGTVGGGVAVDGASPVELHGDLTMTFPPSGPATFHVGGTLGLFFFQIADGALDFRTDGYATFHGHEGLDLGVLGVDAELQGFVDAPTGQFGAQLDGEVRLCADLGIGPSVCGKASSAAAVSNKGFAVCARLSPPGVDAGISYPWSDWDPLYLSNPFAFSVSLIGHVGGCHIDDYRAPAPKARAAQAAPGSFTVDIPPGLPTASIAAVGGNSGAPHVVATGPGGQTVAFGQPTKAGAVMIPTGTPAAYVLLDHPAGGTWTISPQPGSPPIASVLQADGYTPASVTATLGGRGRARTIRYRIDHLGHGQSVAFAETGSFGTRLIGSASHARGTLHFRPADARGGRRTVVALIRRSGLTTDSHRIGSYRAPGPVTPGAVRRLKVTRHRTTLRVSWKREPRAAKYSVVVRGAKGTRLGRLVGRSAHAVTFTGVRTGERETVTVRALSAALRAGPARSVRLRR